MPQVRARRLHFKDASLRSYLIPKRFTIELPRRSSPDAATTLHSGTMTRSITGPSDQDRRLSFRCLSLDLEVGVQDRRIHKFAAVRPDTGQSLIFPGAGDGLAAALAKLDDLADGADFLLGPQSDRFRSAPSASRESPFAAIAPAGGGYTQTQSAGFSPQPISPPGETLPGRTTETRTHQRPEAGLRTCPWNSSATSKQALQDASPDLLTTWHWLTTAQNGAGFDRVFASLRGSRRPSDAEAGEAIRALLAGVACQTHAREVMTDAVGHGWALAYALAWLSVSGGNSVMPPWVRHQFPEAGRLVRPVARHRLRRPRLRLLP